MLSQFITFIYSDNQFLSCERRGQNFLISSKSTFTYLFTHAVQSEMNEQIETSELKLGCSGLSLVIAHFLINNTHCNEYELFKDSDKKCRIRTICTYSMFKSMSHAEITLSSVLLKCLSRKIQVKMRTTRHMSP